VQITLICFSYELEFADVFRFGEFNFRGNLFILKVARARVDVFWREVFAGEAKAGGGI
jgi:hypothetical protein